MRSSEYAIIGSLWRRIMQCAILERACALTVWQWQSGNGDEEIAVKEGTNRTKDKPEYMSNSLPTFAITKVLGGRWSWTCWKDLSRWCVAERAISCLATSVFCFFCGDCVLVWCGGRIEWLVCTSFVVGVSDNNDLTWNHLLALCGWLLRGTSPFDPSRGR